MADRTARRRHSAFAAALASLAMSLSLASPAQAVTIQDYIALGDSYAAGVGGGEFLDRCGHTGNAYSEIADDLRSVWDVTNVACGGATSQGVVESQLGLLDKKTDLVTITAGGNNLGFGNLVTYCGSLAFGEAINPVAFAQACAAATAYAEAQLSGPLQDDLVTMIKAVQKAAPKADIVVTGYPYLFDPIPEGLTDPPSLFIYQANDLAKRLNATIEAAAEETGVVYVDVTDEFAGHGINSATSWIVIGSMVLEENFHPNAKGYEAYFAALYSESVYN